MSSVIRNLCTIQYLYSSRIHFAYVIRQKARKTTTRVVRVALSDTCCYYRHWNETVIMMGRIRRPSSSLALTVILLLVIQLLALAGKTANAFQSSPIMNNFHSLDKVSAASHPTTTTRRRSTTGLFLSQQQQQQQQNTNNPSSSLLSTLESSTLAETTDELRQKGLLVLFTVPMAWGSFEPAVRLALQTGIPEFVFQVSYYATATIPLLYLAYNQIVKDEEKRQRQEDEEMKKDQEQDMNEEQDSEDDETSSSLMVSRDDNVQNDKDNDDKFQGTSSTTAAAIRGGIELGTYLFVGNGLQVVGLKTVPADRAAFLLQLTTIFVPLVQAILARDLFAIPLRTWFACFVALTGVTLMGLDGATSDVSLSIVNFESFQSSLSTISWSNVEFSFGDILVVLAAVSYSFHCIRLEKFAKTTSAIKLGAAKATTETFWSFLVVLGSILVAASASTSEATTTTSQLPGILETARVSGEGILSYWDSMIHQEDFVLSGQSLVLPAAIAWTGLVTVAYTITAQSFGQAHVSPSTANLIYSIQPLFTSIIAWIVLGETLGPAGYVGGALIGSAVLLVVQDEGDDDNSDEVNDSDDQVDDQQQPPVTAIFTLEISNFNDGDDTEADFGFEDQRDSLSTKGWVLVVDDEEPIRNAVAGLLSDSGYQVTACADAPTALKVARSRIAADQTTSVNENSLPDCIVSDIRMPKMDGIELLRKIRLDATLSEVPIVLLTAKGMTKDRIQGYDAGADAYLCKPFDPDELVAVVDNVIDRHATLSGSDVQVDDLKRDLDEIKFLLLEKGGGGVGNGWVEQTNVFLAPDEREVLELLCEGLTTKEIAEKSFISTRRVGKQKAVHTVPASREYTPNKVLRSNPVVPTSLQNNFLLECSGRQM